LQPKFGNASRFFALNSLKTHRPDFRTLVSYLKSSFEVSARPVGTQANRLVFHFEFISAGGCDRLGHGEPIAEFKLATDTHRRSNNKILSADFAD